MDFSHFFSLQRSKLTNRSSRKKIEVQFIKPALSSLIVYPFPNSINENYLHLGAFSFSIS